MRKLILVRHSLPEFTEGVPAHQWSLSAEGRQRCVPLAEGLGAYEPVAVVTSTEPKAVETGQVIADHLSLLLESADGLREHHRSQPVVLDAETPFEAPSRSSLPGPESSCWATKRGTRPTPDFRRRSRALWPATPRATCSSSRTAR